MQIQCLDNNLLIFKIALIAKNYFHCPQCRYRNYPNRGLDTFPKNTLLGNLISSISISKAACPQCKTTNSNLTVCEHCSEIFCKECMNVSCLL